uniref:Uncharacterized protein n=1 Tax=Amphimedon queenslandica TaxID=400682 RepID=A0A1X7VT17_AMPQE
MTGDALKKTATLTPKP